MPSLENFRDPGSQFRLLPKHRSAFQFPHAQCSGTVLQSEAWAGIEPAHKSFADSRVTTSPPGHYACDDCRALKYTTLNLPCEVIYTLTILFAIVDFKVNVWEESHTAVLFDEFTELDAIALGKEKYRVLELFGKYR